MKLNQVRCENCLQTIAAMADDFVDLIVTSPPYDEMREYGGGSLIEFEAIAKSLYRVMKRGGVIVWVVGDESKAGNESGTSFRQALYFKEVGFNLFDTMIYLKPPRGAVGDNRSYWQSFEYMFVFSKGKPKTINLIKDRKNKDVRDGDRGTKRLFNGDLRQVSRGGYAQYGRRTNVWQYQIGRGHSATHSIAYQHPAIFPERLAEDHIISWSNKGDLVYDPFLGSGTTALMAQANGRNYLGSELSAAYCAIARQRLQQAPPPTA